MNAYEINQLASGIEVGDIVKVLRKAENDERNWPCWWVESMDSMVGNVFKVSSIRDIGIVAMGTVDGQYISAYVPYFVLEIVKKA